ncbi:MAG: SGNH/GDSL hydrolase family protein [Candidatus Sumerlaeota bacterium]|nr:SGNH/GDSL hydrolase family protein [Candidatus Sumerlaeota bacterium]
MKNPFIPRAWTWVKRHRWRLIFAALSLGIIIAMALELMAHMYLANCWGFLHPDPILGWSYNHKYRRNALIAKGGYRIVKQEVQINSQGLHDREIPYEKPENTFRILCIGDSIVEAFQVPFEAMFTKRLEKYLAEQYPGATRYEVINGGNGNFGTDQEYLFYQNEGKKYKPDIVLLFLFPLNDYSDNLPELNDRAYLPKPFFTLKDGHLVPPKSLILPPPASALQKNNRFIRFASRFRAYMLAQLYLRNYFRSISGAFESAGIFAPLFVQTKGGYPLFYDVHKYPLGPAWQRAVDLTEALVAAMWRDVEKDGASFRVVIVPFSEVMTRCWPDESRRVWAPLYRPEMKIGQPEQLARDFLKRLDIKTLDLTDTLIKANQGTNSRTHLMPDGHFSEYGHDIVARALIKFLKECGDLSPPRRAR